MAINGDTLGVDITDEIEALGDPWPVDMRNQIEPAWKAAGRMIADHVNPELAPAVPDFTAPTLLNSWTNAGGNYHVAGYYKYDERVYLVGTVTGGVASAIFTLPTGYRPLDYLVFPVSDNGLFGSIQVRNNGNIIFGAFPGTAVSLDGISFRAGK